MQRRPPTSERILDVGITLAAALLALPALSLSVNLHSPQESSAMNRLVLGLRTFWPDLRTDPASFSPDPNFPLGTALVFATPFAVGLDPVWWGRLWALALALVATVLARRLLSPIWGRGPAILGALALWAMPAFVRGAVVSGEETTALTLLLAALLVRPPVLAGVLAGAAVLFRLDMLLFAPAILLARSPRGAARGALGMAPLLALPLVVGALVYGDPLGPGRIAQAVTAAAGRFEPRTLLAFPATVWAMVGPLALVVPVVLGADRRQLGGLGRALVALALIAWGVSIHGTLEVRFHRYFVPVLALWIPLVVAAVAARRPRLGAAVAVALIAGGLVRSVLEARAVRWPAGLEQAAELLGQEAPQAQVMTDRFPDALIILGGLHNGRVEPIASVETGFPGAPSFAEQADARGTEYVVLAGDGESRRAARASARLEPWWQGGTVEVLRWRR